MTLDFSHFLVLELKMVYSIILNVMRGNIKRLLFARSFIVHIKTVATPLQSFVYLRRVQAANSLKTANPLHYPYIYICMY